MDLGEEVWRDYVNVKSLFIDITKGNYRLKSTRVPRISFVAAVVQHFVLGRQKNRQRTVAKDVMDFLGGYGFITVNRENNKDVNMR